jgi:RNA recognition motif-containing protein
MSDDEEPKKEVMDEDDQDDSDSRRNRDGDRDSGDDAAADKDKASVKKPAGGEPRKRAVEEAAPADTSKMHTLKVDNITFETTSETLRPRFEKFGEVGDVYIPKERGSGRSRGFAFVRFMVKKDAEDAMKEMDNQVGCVVWCVVCVCAAGMGRAGGGGRVIIHGSGGQRRGMVAAACT